jgi:hypothetical protein
MASKICSSQTNVCMPSKDYYSEHKRLIRLLLKGSKKQLKEEAAEQSTEMKNAKPTK